MRPRDKLILDFWDRSKELTIKNKQYRNFVYDFFNLLLKSDIKGGDITTSSIIDKNKKAKACIVAQEDGIIAGIEEFSFLNKDLKLKLFKKDRVKIKKNEILIEIEGNAEKILQRERTNLNFLQRMSGIATTVNALNKQLDGKVKIASTRKALWGLLDKKAVSVGNGLTHRLNLNDGILIKENHLKLVDYNFEKAVNSAKSKSKYIEIEVEDKEHALMAANAIKKIIKRNNKNLFALMLDKINSKGVKKIIAKIKDKKLYDSILFEASGNINQNNVHEYLDCDVDIISMGSITNSTRVLNMSQEVI